MAQRRLSVWQPLWIAVFSISIGATILVAEWLYIHPDSPSLGALLSVVADFVPMGIAIAGIIMSYRAPKRKNHLSTTIILITSGLLGTVILSWTRIRNETAHRSEIAGLNIKIDKVGAQNTILGNFLLAAKDSQKLSEADRRKAIETVLRNQYILTHNPIDPEILAGNKMPPQDWMIRG